MSLGLTPDQEALRDAVVRLFAKESSPERVREAETTGFDERLWHGLTQLGAVAMGVPEEHGGGDASLADLAVVVEQHGAHLGSVPLVEAMVAARLLARCGDRGADALASVLDGGVVVFSPVQLTAGAPALVAGAAAAALVVAFDGASLVLVDGPGAAARVSTTDLGASARVVPSRDGGELLDGEEARRAFEEAVDEWRALTSIALTGLARAALDIGVQYVKDRHQFGVPIGSFQTVQHRLADTHTMVDGASLLAWESVGMLTRGEDLAPTRAAQAYVVAGEAAEEAASWSLHFHGGYGFMLEYDVQLHLRRAKAWRLGLGDPRRQYQVVADRLWAGEHVHRLIDVRIEGSDEAWRDEVRSFINEHLTSEIVERAHETGTMHDWGFHRALCERGYLAAGWPQDVGGLGRSAVDTTTLMQELFYAGAPVDAASIAAMVGATLMICGTEEQQRDIVPRILAGEVLCCLGYSEPDAGSDVAAVQTRAVRDGDQWIVNGQKMFTTMAHEAQYVFLLCRTNTEVPKHKGLTMFLVPMDTPGIEITPVHTLGGERTNITFYTEVRVPDSYRVGDVDGGWSVMHAALVYERNSANWGEPAALVDAVASWATDTTMPDGTRPIDDVFTRERLARHATAMEVGRALIFRSAHLAAAGAMPHVEGSMAKLWITERFTAAASDFTDLLGSAGLVRGGEPDAPLAGLVEHAYRHAQVTTIYGGSSEVQRGIVAERGLGLPRTR